MTNQEMFDKVVAHARKQKAKAVNAENFCGYRTEDGKKCFIGALIPDEKYVRFLENKFSDHPAVMEAAGLRDDQRILASGLQSIHDHNPVFSWEQLFQKAAKQYNLTYTPPHEELTCAV